MILRKEEWMVELTINWWMLWTIFIDRVGRQNELSLLERSAAATDREKAEEESKFNLASSGASYGFYLSASLPREVGTGRNSAQQPSPTTQWLTTPPLTSQTPPSRLSDIFNDKTPAINATQLHKTKRKVIYFPCLPYCQSVLMIIQPCCWSFQLIIHGLLCFYLVFCLFFNEPSFFNWMWENKWTRL